jgi:hypothetical protein
MSSPTPPGAATSSSSRIPLHSAIAQPLLCGVTAMNALGIIGLSLSALEPKAGVHPVAILVIALALGLTTSKMWARCQRVYATKAGIELTKPPRLIPWRKIGDTFRVPLLGSFPSTCCIGINDTENWDLYFYGRCNFEAVIARFRSANDRRCTADQERADIADGA